MRMLQRLFLFVVVSLAASVLAPAVASGQEVPVTVIDEATAEPCDPCVVHMAGESHVVSVVTGAAYIRCHDEYQLTLYPDGSGEIDWVGLHHATGGFDNCYHSSCPDGASHWPIVNPTGGAGAIVELGDGTAHMRFRICIVSGTGVRFQCDIEATFDDTGTPHQYVLDANQVCFGTVRYEMNAAVESENIEIVHSE